MKRVEWLIAVALVVIGLSCLTMSATYMLNPNSLKAYLNNFLQICIWIGIPMVIIAVTYYLLKKKGKS
jgi:Na+-driven multidrug efflux pump